MEITNILTEKKQLTFTISQRIKASTEMVFSALSDSTILEKWWGPKDYIVKVLKLDFRSGGIFHYKMKAPEGIEMWGKLIYRKIEKPNSFVFASSYSDANAGVTRNPMIALWPLEILNTLTLTDKNGTTKVKIEGHPINASEEELNIFSVNLETYKQGIAESFEKLADLFSNI